MMAAFVKTLALAFVMVNANAVVHIQRDIVVNLGIFFMDNSCCGEYCAGSNSKAIYIHDSRYPVCREFTMQVQQLQKKTPISDTAKNVKTLQETEYGCLPSYYAN